MQRSADYAKSLAFGEQSSGLYTVLEYWWSKKSLNVHTQIPARVVSLDLPRNRVTIQPLIKTFFTATQAISYDQLLDIPLKIVSGNRGQAKLTMPIKVGDIGMVYFSERDPSTWLNTDGQQIIEPFIKEPLSCGLALYPIAFEVGIFTPTSAIDYDPVNVVLQNEESILIMAPDGNVRINGCTITPDGNVITAQGVNLDEFYQAYLEHVHSLGTGTTGTIA